MAPELGLTQPGMTIVCGDSHTSTHGAFGAFAFGIGTSEVEHVLATQCLLQHKPKTMRVRIDGTFRRCVGAKDMILALIAKLGVDGATGHVIEYAGDAVSALDMEARMTVCTHEHRSGRTRRHDRAGRHYSFQYLATRDNAPKGSSWDEALSRWLRLPTDEGAAFDREVILDAGTLAPMITWGTTPAMAIPIGAPVPTPAASASVAERVAREKALAYMGLSPGELLTGRSRSTSSSSAPAPTVACRICAPWRSALRRAQGRADREDARRFPDPSR